MDVRNIDSAGRLHDRASVTRTLMRSLLWAAILYFSSAILGAVFLPGENLSLAEWPRATAAPLVLTLALLIATSAILWSAGLPARIAAALLLALIALWFVDTILLVFYIAEGGPRWLATAFVRVPLVGWIAAEAGLGCIALICARQVDLQIAREPVGSASLLGAPPALAYLARGQARARALFVLATFMFAFAVLQFPSLQYSAAQSWSNAFETCAMLQGEERAACFSRVAIGDLAGQFLLWPLTIVIVIAFARAVRARARRLAIRSAAAAMAADQRPPILFLRWFGNDEGEIAKASQPPLRWLLGATLSEPTVDRMLVEEFSRLGPTVALGSPEDRNKPSFGVWRDFPDDKDWKSHFRQMAESAAAIVMMVDVAEGEGLVHVSEGVRYELSILSEPGLKAKTMFVAGTHSLAPERHARLWTIVADLAKVDVPSRSEDGARFLAVFQKTDGALAVAVSHRFTRGDYAMALRWFFASRPPAT